MQGREVRDLTLRSFVFQALEPAAFKTAAPFRAADIASLAPRTKSVRAIDELLEWMVSRLRKAAARG